MISSIIDMTTSMIFLETYKVGKIILTTIIGIRVLVLSHKAYNGLDAETYGKDTKGMMFGVAIYYCLPFIKDIIKSLY